MTTAVTGDTNSGLRNHSASKHPENLDYCYDNIGNIRRS